MVSALLALPLLIPTTIVFAAAPPVSTTSSTSQMMVSSGNSVSPLLTSKGDCGYSTIDVTSTGSTSALLRWGLGTSLGVITSYNVDITMSNGDYDSAESIEYLSATASGQMTFQDLSPSTYYSATLTGTVTVETDSSTLVCTIIPGTVSVNTKS